VGPIYDKVDKLEQIQKLIKDYDLIIFNGSLCYPYDNLELVEKRISIMDQYMASRKVFYNLSQHDLLLSKELFENGKSSKIYRWLRTKPNVIFVEFKNQTSNIITGGGLTPQMKRDSLMENIETSFVSYLDNEPWHKKYGGINGYVISNNPLTLLKPHFYKYSAQIGNAYTEETRVYAQEVSPFGLKRTILL
jgi:hypothetical protein